MSGQNHFKYNFRKYVFTTHNLSIYVTMYQLKIILEILFKIVDVKVNKYQCNVPFNK